MRNVVTTRNWIIVTLCITIVFMAIGFAILSMQLDEKGNSKAVHDTSFVTINPRTPVQGGTKVPSSTASITNSGQTINFEFQLYAPSDEISYRITIKNQGTIDAEIINLVEYPDYLNNAASAQSIYPVEVKHNNIIPMTLDVHLWGENIIFSSINSLRTDIENILGVTVGLDKLEIN